MEKKKSPTGRCCGTNSFIHMIMFLTLFHFEFDLVQGGLVSTNGKIDLLQMLYTANAQSWEETAWQ